MGLVSDKSQEENHARLWDDTKLESTLDFFAVVQKPRIPHIAQLKECNHFYWTIVSYGT